MAREEPSERVRDAVRSARAEIDRGDPETAVARLGKLETEGLTAADWVAVGRAYREADAREAARIAGRRALDLSPRDREGLDLLTTPYLVDGIEHSVPLIGANAKTWDTLGRVAVIFGILVTVTLVVTVPFAPPNLTAKNPLPSMIPKATVLAFVTIASYLAVSVYALSWLVMDVLDRKSRMAWIVLFPVFFLLGLPWVPLALYRWLRTRLSVAKRPIPT